MWWPVHRPEPIRCASPEHANSCNHARWSRPRHDNGAPGSAPHEACRLSQIEPSAFTFEPSWHAAPPNGKRAGKLQGHRQRFFNALAAMQQERCVRQYDEMDSGKTKQGLEHRRQISPNEQDLNSHHIAPASCWPTGLPPGVKIVVAFNSSMANCPAASFHDQNTAFLLLSRIQRAGTAQSQTSRYTFRYQHCRRAQHGRRHAQGSGCKAQARKPAR